MKRILSILLNVGLAACLLYSLLLVVLYFSFLIGRITNPGQKNWNDEEAIQYGIVALAVLIVDYFIAKRLVRAFAKGKR